MPNSPSARPLEPQPDGTVGAEYERQPSNTTTVIASQTTTIVRAEVLDHELGLGAVHPLLQAQLRELKLRKGGQDPDVGALLSLVSQHYHSIDEERRGIVRSMQLMADEVRTLAADPNAAKSSPLQVILDHIKETVLTVDERGLVRTFNPTGFRVFGYTEDEVVGQPLELLIPQITDHGSAVQGLDRLAAATGDTHLDLAPREIWGRRASGEVFPAEIAVSRARVGRHDQFIVCLRDVTERRSSERHLRESEARYRLLVDHAPEAIIVVDADTRQFVDVNAHAVRLFGLPREELLKRRPSDLSPPVQPGGFASNGDLQGYFRRAVAGEPQRFEWVHRDSHGREFVCEVNLLSLPSATRGLVRGSIVDISDRKRAERLHEAERTVLEQIASRSPLATVLESVTCLLESSGVAPASSVSLLGPDRASFSTVVAPRLEPALRSVMGRALVGIRAGSCAAAVYLNRQVLVADVGKDPLWQEHRDVALAAGVRAVWSTPVESAGGKVLGALGVFKSEVGLPTEEESRIIADAVQLAGIAVEQHHADEARRQAEQAVFDEKERAEVTLQSIGDAVIRTGPEGRIEYLNPVAERLTGWSLDQAHGHPLAEVVRLIDEGTRHGVDPMRELHESSDGARDQHLVLVKRSGEQVAVHQTVAPINDAAGSVVGSVFVFHDVTQERHLKRALSYQASHDALTGLINRREFDRRLQSAVTRVQRGGEPHAVLYVDLDQFKLVNDTCGHQAGDRLLRNITGLLRARVRASDSIARLGGDEFGILLVDCTLEHATHIADAIRQAIYTYRFAWGTDTLSVGASIGIVEITTDRMSAASVMSAADIACYAAKEAGRNRMHVYTTDGASGREREMHWASRITRAVEEGRLELHFQPIIPVGATGAGFGQFHELMVRLRDEDGRLILPGEFIPAAERYNVMPAIDRWVVLKAIEIVRGWPKASGAAPLLAVNLSGNSLSDPSFLDFVLEHTGESDVARSLCFEVTETAAVTNLADAAYFMQELRERGCKFALDDFGSGLSSFMYLKTLPVDYLKIDGQFVTHMAASPVDRSMIEAIRSIGRALGIATIAECVESAEVLAELERIGVDFAQGYLFGHPAPIEQLSKSA